MPAATRIEITSKGPSLLEFRAVGDIVRSVTVTGLERAAKFGPNGVTMLHSPRANAQSALGIDYRFELAAGIGPGAYDWPVSLTVLPM